MREKRKHVLCVGLSPFPVIVANEGLVRNPLLNMKQSWWSLLLGRGTTQFMCCGGVLFLCLIFLGIGISFSECELG